MALARTLFKILLSLFVVTLLIGVVLPDSAQVERQLNMQASVQKVFPQINSLRAFHAWSPWRSLDPDTEYSFSGPETGVGAKMVWQSTQTSVGIGSMQIVRSEHNQAVQSTLDFGGKGGGKTTFFVEPTANGQTEVRWHFEAEFGWDLYGRYIGLLLDNMLGPSYEKGLANLKTRVEQES